MEKEGGKDRGKDREKNREKDQSDTLCIREVSSTVY